jgi:hypothetical protein
MIRRLSLGLVIAGALLGSTGCVTFERETMAFTFSPDGKEIHGLLLYEGIHSDVDNEMGLKIAKQQLAEFVQGGQSFCLGDNWILRVKLEEKVGADKQTPLSKYIRVKNNGFFLDRDGKLCGYQTLTVSNADRLVADLNALINAEVGKAAAAALKDPQLRGEVVTEADLKLWQQAAEHKHAWIKLEPGRFSAVVPMTPELFQKGKDEVVKQIARLREQADKLTDKDLPPAERKMAQESVRSGLRNFEHLARILAANPVSVEQRKNQVTVALGLGEGEPIRLLSLFTPPQPVRPIEKDLIAYARTLDVPFLKEASADRILADFLKEAGRKP